MNFFTKKEKPPETAVAVKSKRQLLLEAAFEILARDPEAQKLLDMARTDHVGINCDALLFFTGAAAQYVPGCSRSYPQIKVSPLNTPQEIASSLTHELRHHWQYKKLGLTHDNLSYLSRNPRMEFMLNKVLEADAYAFQRRFAAVAEGGNPIKDKVDYLAEQFVDVVKDKKIADYYDPVKARSIHDTLKSRTGYKTKRGYFDKAKSVPELSISDLRALLKAGVDKDAPGYLDGLSDRQFETLILKNADREAFHAVYLMEKFRVAVGRKDEKTAEALRPLVRRKIFGIP